jgi:hypothetical protein
MKPSTTRIALLSLLLCVSLLLPAAVSAQEVKLEDVSFQEVLDRLFGTAATPGLLDGDEKFQFHAEGVVLTSDQLLFFVPTDANTSDFADLIAAAEQIRGAELKIQGLIDGVPFDLKLSGKQVKLDGITLTQAELDVLVEELQGIEGLHEAKIQAFVDGEEVVVKIENIPGRVKIEGGALQQEARGRGMNEARGALNRPEKLERPVKPERAERIERFERPERGGRP